VAAIIVCRFQSHVRVDAAETHRADTGAQVRRCGEEFALFESAECRPIFLEFFVRIITADCWRKDLGAECHRRFDQTSDACRGLGMADDRFD